ncbi:TPA: MerR family transcriptional regulator [Streptococcus pyogenes]|uniref:MerR family transcriptional regulator n=1 Tax=uncultured Streptococcus sp. TaxID=83427 RepID=UPI0026291EFC|nr:MerR family transcriptional regulator [uncultured Streptococcus sp.]HEP6002083.1 MerR family transcriptional regulator [Streptococcus pyogenes]
MALELFGDSFKAELFEELVELNKQALAEAKRQVSKKTTWVTITELKDETGWGRSTLETWRDQGKFRSMQKSKGGKYLYDLEDAQRFCRSLAK